jgi:pimeloyl-ACP methyl ester carboxylesterase
VTDTTLFLLPGLLNDARLWHYQISGLSDVASPTVADLTVAHSISTLASMALNQAPAGRFALAGLSMGGYVALEIMRQAPGRISALALLDTSARPDTAQATEGRRNLMQLAETNFPAVTDTLLPRLVHPSRLTDTSIVTTIRAMAESIGKDAFLRQQRAIIARIDSRPFLAQIQCPTLVLCGREDVITPIEVHQELSSAIPNSSLTIIEECGHLSTLDRPQQVTDALRKWLSNVKP